MNLETIQRELRNFQLLRRLSRALKETSMCTITMEEATNAEPVDMNSHPIAKLVAAVRERCRSNKLNFLLADKCLSTAREHYAQHGSLVAAIDAGQRQADTFAGKHRVHTWRDPQPPRSVA